jgi:hypothetical protein
MTKDEALDLALEALDNLLYWDNGKSDYDQAREAITAIKQARSAPVQETEVSWGVDWGRVGDKSCAMIIKRLPDGKIEVVAVEYEP